MFRLHTCEQHSSGKKLFFTRIDCQDFSRKIQILAASEAKSIGWLDEVTDTPEATEAFILTLTKFSPAVVQAQKKMLTAVKRGREDENGNKFSEL